MKTLALAVVLAAAPIVVHAQEIAPDSVFGIEYANDGGESLHLDLLLPLGNGPFPVIVAIHGGGWTSGDRTQTPAFLQVARGYAVAQIDYRLAPAATFPAQIEDCKAAVRWLRANAARYHLDPRAIGVMGFSAGGHLAALLGTSSGAADLEGPQLGNAGYSSRVDVVIDYFGPTDLLQVKSEAPACMPEDPDAPDQSPSLFIGCPIQSCKEKTESANPIHYVSKDDPPVMILHGTADCLVPWQQSLIFYNALRAAGVEAKFLLIPGLTHADPGFLLPPIELQVEEFLDKHLKRGRGRMRAVGR